jgi:hypothetical protein
VITSHGASEAFRNAAMDPDPYIEYPRRRSAAALAGCAGQRVLVYDTVGANEGALVAEAVDTVVAVAAPRPALDLVPALTELGLPYQIVGDAPAPRTALHAFKEGHEAALAR